MYTTRKTNVDDIFVPTGTTYYCDPNGSDANDGLYEQDLGGGQGPVQTLQHVADNLLRNPGDGCQMAQGHYKGFTHKDNPPNRNGASGTGYDDQAITYFNKPGANVHIDIFNSMFPNSSGFVTIDSVEYVRLFANPGLLRIPYQARDGAGNGSTLALQSTFGIQLDYIELDMKPTDVEGQTLRGSGFDGARVRHCKIYSTNHNNTGEHCIYASRRASQPDNGALFEFNEIKGLEVWNNSTGNIIYGDIWRYNTFFDTRLSKAWYCNRMRDSYFYGNVFARGTSAYPIAIYAGSDAVAISSRPTSNCVFAFNVCLDFEHQRFIHINERTDAGAITDHGPLYFFSNFGLLDPTGGGWLRRETTPGTYEYDPLPDYYNSNNVWVTSDYARVLAENFKDVTTQQMLNAHILRDAPLLRNAGVWSFMGKTCPTTTDVDGDERDTITPDIGHDEFAKRATIYQVSCPGYGIPTGSTPVAIAAKQTISRNE